MPQAWLRQVSDLMDVQFTVIGSDSKQGAVWAETESIHVF
eukprot:SAG31_NODE_42579_length_271_cov_0.581395_1_plen_39_part_10